MLLPVRDVGLAAVIRASADGACLRLAVGERAVRFRPQGAGRFMLVAGRLDGRFVAAAWPLAAADERAAGERSVLFGRPPAAWQLAEPWVDARPDGAPLLLECRDETPPEQPAPAVEKLFAWRDILHRPAADAIVEWRLGQDECFVLGDFPSGSRDSRQWGPIPADRILHHGLRAVR